MVALQNDDREAKLRETVGDALRRASEALDSVDIQEFDKRTLQTANAVLLDQYFKLMDITQAMGGSRSLASVEIWNAAIGMINASLHIGATAYRNVSARQGVLDQQARFARRAQSAALLKKQEERRSLLAKYIPDLAAAKKHPSSTAESILDAVNADLRTSGKQKGVTTQTIQRWINDLPNPELSDIS